MLQVLLDREHAIAEWLNRRGFGLVRSIRSHSPSPMGATPGRLTRRAVRVDQSLPAGWGGDGPEFLLGCLHTAGRDAGTQ